MRRVYPVLAALMLLTASLACSLNATGVNPPQPLGANVVFIAPENNAVIVEGAPIEFAVQADDPGNAVAKIDFFVDDSPIGTQNDSTPGVTFIAHQVWTATGAQGHFLSAVASRADNTKIGEARVSVQVVPISAISANATQSDISQSPTPPADGVPLSPPPTLSISTAANTATPSGNTPTATAIPPTPIGPYLQVVAPSVYIRSGDGTIFNPPIGALKQGDTASIIGRNAATTWWVVQKNSVRGWVINSPTLIKTNGDLAQVPLVQSPVTPTFTPAPATSVAASSTPGNFADLVFGTVTLNPTTPTHGQTFTVSITLTNVGSVDAGTSLLKGVFQPGNEESDTAVPAIKAGGAVTVTLPVTLQSGGQNQTATLTLDANNNINEGPTGESNNTKGITYNVN